MTWTAEDILAGYRLAARMSLRTAVILIVAAATGYGAFFALDPDPFLRAGVGLGGLCGGAMGLLAYRQLFLPWRARYDFARYPLAQQERSYAMSAEGLRVTAKSGETRFRWSDFIGWRANATITILYASPRTFHAVPARLEALGFPYRAFRAEVERNVPRRR